MARTTHSGLSKLCQLRYKGVLATHSGLVWTVPFKNDAPTECCLRVHRWIRPQSTFSSCLFYRNILQASQPVTDYGRKEKTCRAPVRNQTTSCGKRLLFRQPAYIGPLSSLRFQSTLTAAPPPPDIPTVSVEPTANVPIVNPEHVSTLLVDDAGSLRSLGLGSYFTPVGWMQLTLDFIHTHTGLQWWGVIVLVTVLVRAALVKFVLKAQAQSYSLVSSTKTERERLRVLLDHAKQRRNYHEVQYLTAAMAKLNHETLFGPDDGRRRFVPVTMKPSLYQLSIFLTFFFAIRNISATGFEGFASGGALWFTNLTQPDPTFILPAINVACMTMTFFNVSFSFPLSEKYPWIRVLLVPFSLLLFYFNTKFSAAVLCYWATSSAITLIQSLMLNLNRVRQLLNYPPYINYYQMSLKRDRGFTGLVNFLIQRNISVSARTTKDKVNREGRAVTPKLPPPASRKGGSGADDINSRRF